MMNIHPLGWTPAGDGGGSDALLVPHLCHCSGSSLIPVLSPRQFTHSCSFPQAVHSFLFFPPDSSLIPVLSPRQFTHSCSFPSAVHSFLVFTPGEVHYSRPCLFLPTQLTYSCSFPQAVHSFLSVLALAHAELILVLALAVHAFLFLPRQFSHSFSCPDRVIHSFLFLPRQFTRPGFAKQFTHSCSCPGSSLILVLPRQFTHSRSCTGGSLIPVLAQAVHWFMFFGFPLISILAQAFTHSSLLSRAISFHSLLPFGREVCEWLSHADHSLLFFFRQFPHSSPCSSVHSSSNCLISYQFTLSLKTSLLTHSI